MCVCVWAAIRTICCRQHNVVLMSYNLLMWGYVCVCCVCLDIEWIFKVYIEVWNVFRKVLCCWHLLLTELNTHTHTLTYVSLSSQTLNNSVVVLFSNHFKGEYIVYKILLRMYTGWLRNWCQWDIFWGGGGGKRRWSWENKKNMSNNSPNFCCLSVDDIFPKNLENFLMEFFFIFVIWCWCINVCILCEVSVWVLNK